MLKSTCEKIPVLSSRRWDPRIMKVKKTTFPICFVCSFIYSMRLNKRAPPLNKPCPPLNKPCPPVWCKRPLNIFDFFRKIDPPKDFWPRKIIFAKSSETRFPKVSRQSEPSSGGKRLAQNLDFFEKWPPEKKIGLGRSFLQNRPKRVSPKFHADRSHPRGVKRPAKILDFFENWPPLKYFT